jgi:hypothetical protein
MTLLSTFCARTGIDESAARRALETRAARDVSPWYVQTVLGIGAWISAIAALFFIGIAMDLVLGIDEPNPAFAVVGAVVFGAGLWLLHRQPEGAFAAHAAAAFATAGTLLAAAGIGMPEHRLWVAAVATLPFAAAAIWQQRSLLLQFLIVSIALTLGMLALWEHWDDRIADLSAFLIPFGVALLLYPPRLDLRPTAFALLIVPMLLDITASGFDGRTLWFGWPAKGVMLVVFALLFAINWRRVTDRQARLLALAAVAAAVVALLLPAGASAAAVLLVLAYTVGSRTLAVLGTLTGLYFIWRFYWDMEETLLTKSIILMSAGAVLLLCYGLLFGAQRERGAA